MLLGLVSKLYKKFDHKILWFRSIKRQLGYKQISARHLRKLLRLIQQKYIHRPRLRQKSYANLAPSVALGPQSPCLPMLPAKATKNLRDILQTFRQSNIKQRRFRKRIRMWHSELAKRRHGFYWSRKYGLLYPRRAGVYVQAKQIKKTLRSGKIIYATKRVTLPNGKTSIEFVYGPKRDSRRCKFVLCQGASRFSGKRLVNYQMRDFYDQKGNIIKKWKLSPTLPPRKTWNTHRPLLDKNPETEIDRYYEGPLSYKLYVRPEYKITDIYYRFRQNKMLRRTQPWAESLAFRRSFLNFRLFFRMVRREKRGFRLKYTKLYQHYHRIVQNKWRQKVGRKHIFRLVHLVRKIILPFYGNVQPKFFRKIVKRYRGLKAAGALHRITTYFEQRLDVMAYRLNFAPTIKIARWLIYHGFLKVNDRVSYNHAQAVAPYHIVRLTNVQAWRRIIYQYFYQRRERLYRKPLAKNVLYSPLLKAGLFITHYSPRYFRKGDRVKPLVWRFLVAK